jgi:hypothetical protein
LALLTSKKLSFGFPNGDVIFITVPQRLFMVGTILNYGKKWIIVLGTSGGIFFDAVAT